MEEPQEIDPTQSPEQIERIDELNEELEKPTSLEDVKKSLGGIVFKGIERRALRPYHDVLDGQKERRQTPPSPPRADMTAHTTNTGELQATIIATLKNRPLSESELVQAIVVERGIDPAAQVVKTIATRVHNALQDPLVAKRLVRNSNGTFGLEAATLVGGGSDFSVSSKEKPVEDVKITPKEKVSVIDRMNNIVYGVENFLTKDMEKKTIDPSGEAFLGAPVLHKPSVEVSETTPTVSENPAYKKVVGKLQTLSKTFPAIANTIKAFVHFKVEDQKRFVDILNNLPDIAETVPGSEYTNLVQLAKEGVEYELKGKYVNDPATYGKKAVDLEAEKASWIAPERPRVTQVTQSEGPAEKFLREMAQSNDAKISNTEIATKIDRYVDEALYAIPLKELRKRLALAPAEDMVGIITHSPELTKKQRNELLTILGVQVAIPDDLPHPDGYVPEPPPVVEQEPIPVEDPAARVRSLNERMSEAVVAAKPYDVSVDTITQFSDTWHKEPIGPVNKPSEKSFNQRMREVKQKTGAYNVSENSLREMYRGAPEHGPARKEDLSPEESARVEGELRARLDVTRGDFVRYESEYKQELRKKKSMFRRVMEDLSAAEKQLPNLPEKDPEHKQAEDAYLDAQWVLYNFISGREIKPRPVEGSAEGVTGKKIDIGAANQAESEWDILQREIIKAIPVKERSVISRVFAKWNSYPLPARIALSTAMLTAGGVALGTIGVSGALAAGALRFGRAFAGAQVGLGAGKWFDGVKRKEAEKKRSERLDQHGTEDESVNIRRDKQAFIEKTKEFAQGAEAEKKTIQRNQLVKAGIMAATGGVTTVGLGMSLNAVESISGAPGVKVNPEIDSATKPKGSFLDKFVKKQSPFEPVTAPKVVVPEKIIEAPTPEVYPDPVAVPLSSKGFIDTIGQLKQATEGQKLTPALEKLLNQSPQKIAMDLGLYKPGQAAESAFGYQNEKLSIDINGNLSLEHTGGNEILMDSKGALKPFAGKMFDADKTATSPYPADAVEVPVAPKVVEVIPPTPKPVVEVAPEVVPVEIKSTISKFDVAADAITPATALVEVKPGVPLEFDQTVIKSPEYTGPQDMVFGKLPLKPELQFDPKYKAARVAYNIRFGQAFLALPYGTFDLNYPIEYNGGLIYVLQKGKELIILLNGQEIGTGTIIDGEPGIQYNKSLGTSMFGVKSDFEQAFETAEKAIMKNKMFFKKTQ